VNRHGAPGHAVTAGVRVGGAQPGLLVPQRPYRWHGIPGWDPAKTAGLDALKAAEIDRRCPQCGQQPGHLCRSLRNGKTMQTAHQARYRLARVCPVCASAVGEPCRSAAGLRMSIEHTARQGVTGT
jgi:hypothetical protein